MFAEVSSSRHERHMSIAAFRLQPRRQVQKASSRPHGPGVADGCPVEVRAHPGNTPGPKTVADQALKLCGHLGLRRMVPVNDRGRPMREQIDRFETAWRPENTIPVHRLSLPTLGGLRFGRWLVSRRPGAGRPSSRMAARSAQGPHRFKRRFAEHPAGFARPDDSLSPTVPT